MRILVVGATGVIGRAVADALAAKHEVLRASRKGEVKVDITRPESIREMYQRIGKLDAVVSCAGSGAWKPLTALTDEDIQSTLGDKLMGQVNLVRYGLKHVNDKGVFVLTAGFFSKSPIPGVPAVHEGDRRGDGHARRPAGRRERQDLRQAGRGQADRPGRLQRLRLGAGPVRLHQHASSRARGGVLGLEEGEVILPGPEGRLSSQAWYERCSRSS